jgi:hypothetical protein
MRDVPHRPKLTTHLRPDAELRIPSVRHPEPRLAGRSGGLLERAPQRASCRGGRYVKAHVLRSIATPAGPCSGPTAGSDCERHHSGNKICLRDAAMNMTDVAKRHLSRSFSWNA